MWCNWKWPDQNEWVMNDDLVQITCPKRTLAMMICSDSDKKRGCKALIMRIINKRRSLQLHAGRLRKQIIDGGSSWCANSIRTSFWVTFAFDEVFIMKFSVVVDWEGESVGEVAFHSDSHNETVFHFAAVCMRHRATTQATECVTGWALRNCDAVRWAFLYSAVKSPVFYG